METEDEEYVRIVRKISYIFSSTIFLYYKKSLENMCFDLK